MLTVSEIPKVRTVFFFCPPLESVKSQRVPNLLLQANFGWAMKRYTD